MAEPREIETGRRTSELLLLAALLALPAASARADTVVLEAAKDNTLYEEASGALSNGAGHSFFVGQTGEFRVVRGVLEFDVAGALPAGATVQAATLMLEMTRTNNTVTETISLHPLLAEWGEGISNAGMGEGGGAPSTPGDATWIHTMFSTSFWLQAGGDFNASPSASEGVGGVGSYSWTSSQLAADVQLFRDDPAQNHGWAVIGNEVAIVPKRFSTRESGNPSDRPKLVIEFSPPSSVPALPFPAAALLLALLLTVAGIWRPKLRQHQRESDRA